METTGVSMDRACWTSAFLPYEMKKILLGLKIAGFDISKHGLWISLGCLRNLRLLVETAVQEINRVGKNKYIMDEIYGERVTMVKKGDLEPSR
jgi:hypothetical protein